MDFFDMDFSKLFLNKHGKEIFNYISDTIKNEASTNTTQAYINIIFKLALLDFLGLDKLSIQKLIDNIYPDKKTDIKELLLLHKKSISIIKKHLQNTMDEKNNTLSN